MFPVTTITKRIVFLVCLCLTLTFFPSPSYAIRVQDVPNPRTQNCGWVTDMAQILNPETEAQLNQMISKLEQTNGDEIAVVTVPESTPSLTSKAFTTELFNNWGIGKKKQNNGVLFLVSVRDRRVEIETGSGIKSILSTAYISNVIQQEIIPQFKQGNFQQGILSGTQSLVSKLSQHPDVVLQNTANPVTQLLSVLKKPEITVFLVFCTFWIVFVPIYWMSENLISKAKSKRKYTSGSDTTSIGDSSFSSGGCDFGGGSSGGDGGGDSW
jgi:uncharacterized protein